MFCLELSRYPRQRSTDGVFYPDKETKRLRYISCMLQKMPIAHSMNPPSATDKT